MRSWPHQVALPGEVLRQGSPFGEGRPGVKMGQVALKRPAVGHFLATGYMGLRDRREHDALEEAVLVYSGRVPCPEKRATHEVVLKAWGRLLEPGLSIVLVGQVEMEQQRAEAHERFL